MFMVTGFRAERDALSRAIASRASTTKVERVPHENGVRVLTCGVLLRSDC